MKKLVFACLLLVGCGEKETYEDGKLTCGICNRVVYDGKIKVYSNGFRWPVGTINHCKPDDINCNSEIDSEHSNRWHSQLGYKYGRQDALEFRYPKEFDPKVHHPLYVEAYKKGYKEVIDVRLEGTK